MCVQLVVEDWGPVAMLHNVIERVWNSPGLSQPEVHRYINISLSPQETTQRVRSCEEFSNTYLSRSSEIDGQQSIILYVFACSFQFYLANL